MKCGRNDRNPRAALLVVLGDEKPQHRSSTPPRNWFADGVLVV
jgi:hypothetical protein